MLRGSKPASIEPAGSPGPRLACPDVPDRTFYAQQQTQALVDSTHAEAPWLDARGGLPPDAHSSAPITDDALYSYFSQHARILGMTPADVAMFGPESFITEYKGEEFPDADSPLSQSANLITF
ncbi:hypothetical protein ACQQ7D_11370 [Corynebacterium diphtheriae]